jgi:hypothetical protein
MLSSYGWLPAGSCLQPAGAAASLPALRSRGAPPSVHKPTWRPALAPRTATLRRPRLLMPQGHLDVGGKLCYWGQKEIRPLPPH